MDRRDKTERERSSEEGKRAAESREGVYVALPAPPTALEDNSNVATATATADSRDVINVYC